MEIFGQFLSASEGNMFNLFIGNNVTILPFPIAALLNTNRTLRTSLE